MRTRRRRRVVCDGCGREVLLRKDGTLRMHLRPNFRSRGDYCLEDSSAIRDPMNTRPDSRAADIAQAERLEALFDAFWPEYTAAQPPAVNASALRRAFAASEAERLTPAAIALVCKLAEERGRMRSLLGPDPENTIRILCGALRDADERLRQIQAMAQADEPDPFEIYGAAYNGHTRRALEALGPAANV